MPIQSATRPRWRLRPAPEATPQGAWPPLIGRLLAFRGVRTPAEAHAFFDIDAPVRPLALPDLGRAVERLGQACRTGETVAVFGDFDVDGVTAAALLTEGLGSLGARPIPYLPHRVDEGYGLNVAAIDSLRQLGATLLVTVDCGTSSIDEIRHASRLDIDTIVLDHHTVPPQLPPAIAIVNPKRDPGTTNESAACGIAYYVLRALHDALGPRLNAAGRMAHARLAFDLLVCQDEERARELAAELNALNRERQQATEGAFALADELLADEADAPLLMIGDPEFSLGIVGLVAARLSDSRRRPAVVYQRGERESRASARSIAEFDITGALRTCPELFVRFGGHRAAAGFTAENDKLPAIKERLVAIAEQQLSGLELASAIDIDAELPLSALRGEEIRWLARMAPHGMGNREPVFLSRGVLVAERAAVGQDGAHLRLKLRDGAVAWPAIAFRQTGHGVEEGARVDLVYSLSADRMISDGLQLRVLDVRPSPPAPLSQGEG